MKRTFPIEINKKLFGVLEWIVLNNGTITVFNDSVVLGNVKGVGYRYFISEGWISLQVNKESTIQPAYYSFKSFREAVESYVKDKDNE